MTAPSTAAWVRMAPGGNRQIDESRVLRVLCREGVAARAWEESILCRLLTGLINLPAWLLHKLYLALRATFDDSVFSRLAFEMGHETAVAQSWLIMLLWVIPFSHWNNAYSMLGFAALLVLFYAGAMSRRDFRLDVRHIGFYPVVLFGAMFLAVLFSYEPSASFRFLLYHISAAMCVLVTVSAVRGTEDLKRLPPAVGSVCWCPRCTVCTNGSRAWRSTSPMWTWRSTPVCPAGWSPISTTPTPLQRC